MKKNKGFTLIELLVVMGIIAIIATIVLVAINPARQFKQARDTQRSSNVNTILNAIGQRIADNKGIFEGTFTVGSTNYTCPNLTTSGTGALTAGTRYAIYNDNSALTASSIGLACLVPTYTPSFPVDPSNPTAPNTGYSISVDAAGRITIYALSVELGSGISVTR